MHEVRVALDVGEAIDPHRPGVATRPTSFRPRSTSITCSAISFSSCSSSYSSSRSSASLMREPGCRDRSIADQSVVDSHQHLGRRTDDLNVTRVEQVHVRRGVEGPQYAIEREGIDGARARELLTRTT